MSSRSAYVCFVSLLPHKPKSETDVKAPDGLYGRTRDGKTHGERKKSEGTPSVSFRRGELRQGSHLRHDPSGKEPLPCLSSPPRVAISSNEDTGTLHGDLRRVSLASLLQGTRVPLGTLCPHAGGLPNPSPCTAFERLRRSIAVGYVFSLLGRYFFALSCAYTGGFRTA